MSEAIRRQKALQVLTAPGSTFERKEIIVAGRKCLGFARGPRTLRDLFAEEDSKATFVVYREERLSYAEFWNRSCQVAAVLAKTYGVSKGDRVAIAMRNYPEWLTVFAGITSLGAVAVAINSLWQSDELLYALEDSDAGVLVADDERIDRLSRAPSENMHRLDLRIISVRAKKQTDLLNVRTLEEDLDVVDAAEMPSVDLTPEDDATIFYTSGSTGRPKGVLSCHANILSAVLAIQLDMEIEKLEDERIAIPQAVALVATPLFHVNACHGGFLLSLLLRRRIVLMYKWVPEEAATLIARERVTFINAPSTMTDDLARTAERSKADLSSLAAIGGGGAPRPPTLVSRLKNSFPNSSIFTGWGMTETNVLGANIFGTDYARRPGSCGRPSVGIEFRVIGDQGVIAETGEIGELQVRGASVFKRYWNKPDADVEAFDGDWFRTGDIACIDDEGFVYIKDRIKDIVIRGGENIGCGAVEAAIVEHPAVLEACVYGVPDDRFGEELGATVFATERFEHDALRLFLAPRLAAFEIPKYLFISKKPLSRLATGKIDKRLLREEGRIRWS